MRSNVLAGALGGVALAGAVAAGPANASCSTVSCLQKQVKTLSGQVKKLTKEVKANTKSLKTLTGCLAEAPITRYGDPAGSFGYVFNPGGGQPTFNTTALDGTPSGGTVSVWALVDKCNKQTTAARDMSSGARRSGVMFGAIAPEFLLTQTFPVWR